MARQSITTASRIAQCTAFRASTMPTAAPTAMIASIQNATILVVSAAGPASTIDALTCPLLAQTVPASRRAGSSPLRSRRVAWGAVAPPCRTGAARRAAPSSRSGSPGCRRAGLDAEPAQDAAQIVDLVDAAVPLPRRVPLLWRVVRALHVDRVGRARP